MFTVVTINYTRFQEDERTETKFDTRQEAEEYIKVETEWFREKRKKEGLIYWGIEFQIHYTKDPIT